MTNIDLKTNDGWNCLHIAALQGHLNLCKTLIEKHNFDIHIADNLGWTALHFSSINGSYELVKFLADKGMNIKLKTNNGWNCLHIAALHGHLNLCKTLIDKHNLQIDIADKHGWAALHFSSRNGSYELVKFFADKGININLKTNDGWNCLHIAALHGHLNLCKTLIDKHNFDIHIADNLGWTTLHLSSRNGIYELVKFFVGKGTVINLKTSSGTNCLHIAALNGHLNLCKTLIDIHNLDIHTANNAGWTAIHFSSKGGDYEIFNYFADRVPDVYLKTNDGKNCLHIAAIQGHVKLCKALIDNHDFDVHVVDDDGWTVLHCAAENGSFDLFSYILQKGENEKEIYSKTNCLKNVLHLSALNGHFDICKYVLDYFTKDYEDNNTRKEYALSVGSYKNPLFYKYKIIFLHERDTDGNTYMHLATEKNQAKVCLLLLKYDTEIINLVNKKNKTPRDLAKDNCHEDALNVLEIQYNRTGMLFVYFSF